MNYQDTVNWMFQQLPMYQKQGRSAFKKDLSNTKLLANHLHHPESKFKSIHVAGTNGKGSTSHMLASIFQESGLKVGLYTSPHLKDFRERIKINGKDISKQYVIGFIKRHQSFFESHYLSFFEMTVGLAFDYFARKKVDIAIIEVGLGGRLDSTNIIVPELAIITNIGLDHTQFLGDTYEDIAKEKAGIIKPNVPVVIGESQDETKPVFLKIAKERQSDIFFADESQDNEYSSDLKGLYQKHNKKTVVQSVKVLNQQGYQISETSLMRGLANVVANTGLKGRWQVLQESPKIICDTAHNKEVLRYIVKQLQMETYKQLHIVFGVVNDKDVGAILPILPKQAQYYFCRPDVPRGLDEKSLKSIFSAKGFQGSTYGSVKTALEAAKEKATQEDLIFIGGSTFVVAEIV
ncbi:MAG: bifunctional folylpolyglutamate synthase/dihydrofolate synthase [Algicola sp.]|nr:bifunctional folylpolyglutamate synthase/dihydrofolate synthase [Algicola sp.]